MLARPDVPSLLEVLLQYGLCSFSFLQPQIINFAELIILGQEPSIFVICRSP
jgi:hypothetical protein